jgi:hypothetical protein
LRLDPGQNLDDGRVPELVAVVEEEGDGLRVVSAKGKKEMGK